MNRTLVFCTSYAETVSVWTNRYRLWLNAILSGQIIHEHVLLVDDGSPIIPAWSDMNLTNRIEDRLGRYSTTLYRFEKRLGRQGRAVYPGWYRSFCFAAKFAQTHGFNRVVHIESDGFIISSRMQQYINGITDGWIAPAIQSHAMPESAIQIMAGQGFQDYVDFAKRPYSDVVGIEAENILPLTHVEREFTGSRYGETLHYIPRDADFVTQTNPSMQGRPDYYWWIDPEALPFKNDGISTSTANATAGSSTTGESGQRSSPATKDDCMNYNKEVGPELRHSGENYLDFMRTLSTTLAPKTYFEIGTEVGNSLRAISCDAVCVDPNFKIAQNVLEGRRKAHFFQMPSDDFFAHQDLRAYHPGGLDLAFLDGLHHFEALLRDFINTERYCHNKSLVLLHDCLPLNERMAERKQRRDVTEDASTRDAWTGDVWKLLPILRIYRPDLRVLQFDCGPTGLVGCTGLDPYSRVLSENYDKIVRDFNELTLSTFGFKELWKTFPTIDSRKLTAFPTALTSVLFSSL